MAFLIGFLNPCNGASAFLIPLFANRLGANYNLIQDIGSDDIIRSFLEFEGSVNCNFHDRVPEVRAGERALWAFQYDGQISHGTSEQLAATLLPLLSSRAFSTSPLLESEVAKFCSQWDIYCEALNASFRFLQTFSPTAADIWRDAVVLLPVAKSDLNAILPADFLATNPTLADVRVRAQEKELVVELPRRMFKRPTFATGWDELSKTAELARVFGLNKITISQGPATYQPKQTSVAEVKRSPGVQQHTHGVIPDLKSPKKPKAKTPATSPGSVRLSENQTTPNPTFVLQLPAKQTSPSSVRVSKNQTRPSPAVVLPPPAERLQPAFHFRGDCLRLLTRHKWVIRTQAEDQLAVIAFGEGKVCSFGFVDSIDVLPWVVDTLRHIYPGYKRYILSGFFPSQSEVDLCKRDNILINHLSQFDDFWTQLPPGKQ
jgi:hypothetical protein